MKLVWLAVFFFAPFVSAQTKIRPFFFAIEKDGKTSFVLGTIHGGVPAKDLPPFVMTALKKSHVVATEIPYNPTVARPHIARDIAMPSAATIELLKKRGLPEYLFTSGFICGFYLGWEFHLGRMDSELAAIARQHNITTASLELQSDLDKMLGELATGVETCDIEKTVQGTDPDAIQKFNTDFINEYRKGDFLFTPPLEGFDADRTERWIPQILELHQRKAFIMMGAAHLHGKRGLMALLNDRGFKITRVDSPQAFRKIVSHNRKSR